MKLYYKPGACSLASHIALEEAGLPYQTEAVDLKTKVTASGQDYWQINPKGYVPALRLDSGELLTEGPAILQYVADQAPAAALAPAAGTVARYQLQAWLTFIGTELHRSCTAFFHPQAGDDWKAIARATLERRLSYVDGELQGRAYLTGDGFTVADAYLFTVLSWMKPIGMDLSGWPRIVAFQARVAARPAVQAALKAEGLA
ncbi:glutathione transferase GstA [Ideonella dechloratans]|uniref:Glutathione transferase GstA n=1 Tax=Ideonella dechloratans TaxID=36863 RepID=A0A643FDN9_IDEDE|nr:glutathione transferase GstA [Ideonella dechloratans]KAB0581387.1 glutathione transferase GstA [Ideonella dechloratans]UFU12351.1 glutathione transferase GstA [Ideonella dechloratans]